MPKVKEKPTEKVVIAQTRQKKAADDAEKRWKAEEKAAWDAIRGMWADRKIDALAYQRRARRERKLSWK